MKPSTGSPDRLVPPHGRESWRFLLLLALGMSLGCGESGPKKYPVAGTVSYQETPLPRGMVTFVPEQGRPLDPAPIDPSGRYRLEAPAGEYRVAVMAMPTAETGQAGGNPEDAMPTARVARLRSLIPERFGRYDTSGINVVVEADGENNIDIRLQ